MHNVNQRYHQWLVVMINMTWSLRMRLCQVGIDILPAQALFGRSVSYLTVWSAWLRRTSLDQSAWRVGGI